MIRTEDSFLTTEQFDDEKLLEECAKEVENFLVKNREVIVYRKVCYQRRAVGFFSDTSIGYRYSGKLVESCPLLPHTSLLLRKINQKFNANFNGILVNKYEGGSDYIGAHSDDEKSLDPVTGVVANISSSNQGGKRASQRYSAHQWPIGTNGWKLSK